MVAADDRTDVSFAEMSTHLAERGEEFPAGHGTTDQVSESWGGNKDLTDIQRFYSGASVLVTGATGFMGKVLIEKLLRSCPDIETIYMMVREKKGRSLDERIDDLVSSPCFDRIKKEVPEYRWKLKAVAGDIGSEGLGMSEEDRHLLQRQVNIVFHVAATVRFDEHLKLAILQNVRGTREVLELCKTFRKLRSMVHVSTAYSNCPELQIDERFYEPPIDSNHAIHLAETTDITTLDRLSHKLLGKWPNTYTFTKTLSENIIRRNGADLPIGVVRPSIVLTTANEPMKGWIDNMYGPAGYTVGLAYGILRTLRIDLSCQANVVPCDMVVNSMIATARDVAARRTTSQVTPVYNFVTKKSNPISWRGYMGLQAQIGDIYPCSKGIWIFSVVITNSNLSETLMRLLVHILPAILVDTFLLATNKQPRLLKMYPRVHKFMDLMVYFTTKEWDFENTNVQRMWETLSAEDRKRFAFDMDSLDWKTFFYETWPGLRLHLLKDPMETVPAAKVRLRKLKLLQNALLLLLSTGGIWTASHVVPTLWTALIAVTAQTASYCCRLISNLITPAMNHQLATGHYQTWGEPTSL